MFFFEFFFIFKYLFDLAFLQKNCQCHNLFAYDFPFNFMIFIFVIDFKNFRKESFFTQLKDEHVFEKL